MVHSNTPFITKAVLRTNSIRHMMYTTIPQVPDITNTFLATRPSTRQAVIGQSTSTRQTLQAVQAILQEVLDILEDCEDVSGSCW
jgi:hypothetical protein